MQFNALKYTVSSEDELNALGPTDLIVLGIITDVIFVLIKAAVSIVVTTYLLPK
jgi:hypothetical protein